MKDYSVYSNVAFNEPFEHVIGSVFTNCSFDNCEGAVFTQCVLCDCVMYCGVILDRCIDTSNDPVEEDSSEN